MVSGLCHSLLLSQELLVVFTTWRFAGPSAAEHEEGGPAQRDLGGGGCEGGNDQDSGADHAYGKGLALSALVLLLPRSSRPAGRAPGRADHPGSA